MTRVKSRHQRPTTSSWSQALCGPLKVDPCQPWLMTRVKSRHQRPTTSTPSRGSDQSQCWGQEGDGQSRSWSNRSESGCPERYPRWRSKVTMTKANHNINVEKIEAQTIKVCTSKEKYNLAGVFRYWVGTFRSFIDLALPRAYSSPNQFSGGVRLTQT